MSRIHNKNLCLRCPWFRGGGLCVKTPNDYCRITRSK